MNVNVNVNGMHSDDSRTCGRVGNRNSLWGQRILIFNENIFYEESTSHLQLKVLKKEWDLNSKRKLISKRFPEIPWLTWFIVNTCISLIFPEQVNAPTDHLIQQIESCLRVFYASFLCTLIIFLSRSRRLFKGSASCSFSQLFCRKLYLMPNRDWGGFKMSAQQLEFRPGIPCFTSLLVSFFGSKSMGLECLRLWGFGIPLSRSSSPSSSTITRLLLLIMAIISGRFRFQKLHA